MPPSPQRVPQATAAAPRTQHRRHQGCGGGGCCIGPSVEAWPPACWVGGLDWIGKSRDDRVDDGHSSSAAEQQDRTAAVKVLIIKRLTIFRVRSRIDAPVRRPID